MKVLIDEEFGFDSLKNGLKNRKKPTKKIKRKIKKKVKEKRFECIYLNCARKFSYKWMLERHYNSHFCFKLFKCKVQGCDKSYKSKENLQLHVQNIHEGVKPYTCSYCDSKFSHRNGRN
jgi:uncharacterized Zn-finger protein